jgi:hypothetical protein
VSHPPHHTRRLPALALALVTLPPGTEVSVKDYKAKNGAPVGYSVSVALADGRSFQTGGARDVPSATR